MHKLIAAAILVLSLTACSGHKDTPQPVDAVPAAGGGSAPAQQDTGPVQQK